MKKEIQNKKNKKLPEFLRSVLWSYDVSRMDTQKDKNLIVEQILNYGAEKELWWLIKTYSCL